MKRSTIVRLVCIAFAIVAGAVSPAHAGYWYAGGQTCHQNYFTSGLLNVDIYGAKNASTNATSMQIICPAPFSNTNGGSSGLYMNPTQLRWFYSDNTTTSAFYCRGCANKGGPNNPTWIYCTNWFYTSNPATCHVEPYSDYTYSGSGSCTVTQPPFDGSGAYYNDGRTFLECIVPPQGTSQSYLNSWDFAT